MARRGEYRLVLSADGRVLRQEVKKSEQDLKGFQGEVRKVSDELKRMGSAAQSDLSGSLGKLGGVLSSIGPAGAAAAAGIGALATASTAIAAALVEVTKRAVAYGGNIADMAAKNGMGVESFQALSQGMALTGLTMEQIQKATTKMQVELVKSAHKFRDIGLEANKLRAMDPADAFLKTAKAVAAIQDPASRTAAAFDLFGKAGTGVAAAAAQLGDAATRAQALGNVMSEEVIQALDRTGDSAATLQTTWEHLWLNIGAALGTAPGVAESIDAITDTIGDLSKIVQENEEVFQPLASEVLPAVAGAIVLVGNGVKTLIGLLEQLRGIGPAAFSFLSGGGGMVLDFLKASSGVKPGKAGEKPIQITAPALMGPGVRIESPAEKSAREKAERAAEAARKAWVRAAEQSKKAWADFHQDMFARSMQSIGGIQKSIDKTVATLADRNITRGMNIIGARADERDSTMAAFMAESEEIAAIYVDMAQEADAAFEAMLGGVRSVAQGFEDLGAAVGGALGSVLGFVGQTMGGLSNIAANLRDFRASNGKLSTGDKLSGAAGALSAAGNILSGPGGARGAMSGAVQGAAAGAAFGPLGAAIGGVAGGILGLFGNQDKKRLKEMRSSLAENFGSLEKFAQAAKAAGVDVSRAFSTKDPKEFERIVKKATEAMDKQAAKKQHIAKATAAMGGITGTLQDGKVTGGINIASPESAAAQATIFTSTFWAAVKEQGLVSAVDALSAPFEALREKLSSGGFDVGALLGGVGGIFDALGAEDGAVRGALEGADALKVALEGVANAGYLTEASFGAFQTSARDAFNQAVAGGLDSNQALLAIAPLLGSIISASNEYGIAIDSNTQDLIEQAKAAGAAFPADPILQMRDAVRELVNEIRTLNGLPTRDWGEPPPFGMGGGPSTTEGAKGQPADFVTAARGMRFQKLKRDTVVQAHKDEHIMIVPAGEPVGFKSAASGMGSRSLGATIPTGESTVGGPISVAPVINMVVDPLGIDRTFEKFKDRLAEELAAAIRSGNSPVLRALQDRGKV